jgi:trk system potassium uptake protein TrkA
MYAVVVGGGRIGRTIARWLLMAEHEVAVVDRSTAACSVVEDELGSISVLGDATEAGVLAKVGANRADALIAATGADDVNLVTCQMAMHRFDVSRTISIVNEPENETLFKTLGVGAVVNITDLAVAGIQENLSGLLVERLEDAR